MVCNSSLRGSAGLSLEFMLSYGAVPPSRRSPPLAFIELQIPVWYGTRNAVWCNLAIRLFPSLLISRDRHGDMVFPLGLGVPSVCALLKITTQDLEAEYF